MWIYIILIFSLLIVGSSESKSRRNALQDYQRTNDVRLAAVSDPSLPTKSRKLSLVKCAKGCSRNKRMPFTCRAFLYDHKNRKCQWLSFDRNSPGAQSQHDFNYQLYQKKDYVQECVLGVGLSYKGRASVTMSGVKCQAWASFIPHEHKFLPRINKRKDLRDNYCRNPDNSSSGPWCYTTDPSLRHQECGIPQCSQVECVRCNGENYRGPMDHTESGRECQRWDLEEPHTHLFHPKRYPDKGLDDNYCRNPDGRHRPWCFTVDPHTPWEYCNIRTCDTEVSGSEEVTTQCFRGRGEEYRGEVGVTPSGVACQRWDSQYPHNHTYTPRTTAANLRENYCRNPDGQELPWCFTSDPNVRTAFCTNIPHCDTQNTQADDCYEGSGESYRGDISRTRSGLPCAPWRDHSNSDPVSVDGKNSSAGEFNGERDTALLIASKEGSFCRNPDKDQHGPWCYTNNSAIPWDYCDIKPCEPSQNIIPPMGEVSQVSCYVHKRTRIVGGAPVGIKDGSWMVSIQKGSTHWCGGSLIREEWVLTDRQCFASCIPDLSEYRMWLGVTNLTDRSKRQEVRIAHVICGPEGSNLALIRLAKPALPADTVHTIELPVTGCSIPEGSNCSMYGWGETKGTGHEGVLKVVHLPIVSNERCRQQHRNSLPISHTKICAGGNRDEGVCERDYGGPLVCHDGDNRVIVGVSVNGRGCARANRPGIFINVPFYTQWIYKVFKHYPYPQVI